MTGDALPTVENFNRVRGDVPPQDLVDQSMRNAITMFLRLDVIVDMHRRGLEVSNFIALRRAVLHHSDQSARYASENFQRLLESHGIVCSMSRRGNCWDTLRWR